MMLSTLRRSIATLLVGLAIAGATPAWSQSAMLDCPMRDDVLSIDSPLVDVLLNPAGLALLEGDQPGRFANGPPRFTGTQAPTFAAILTVRMAARLTGVSDERLTEIDPLLRAIPITDEFRAARCARYDNDVPTFTLPEGRPRLLLFEKIVGFRDDPSVDAAHAAFIAMAERNGWAIASTDRAGAINPATLAQFDAVIWNNISGDVLTLSQRKALQDYVEGGGGFVAIHGSAGDPVYFWDWYADTLIGARFLAHPMDPQFQDARVVVHGDHPIAAHLPSGGWMMNEEWYSFRSNPRSVGAQVVLSLDESSYSPVGPGGIDLRMGDHPLAWTHCVGRGRSFYSAIGHRPELYADANHLELLQSAIQWATAQPNRCGS